ncbi:hypothetical protein KFL_004550080 [Klebsormidium nitens]|uniref:Uncharacterized protein n=1 Tax=Klebsormidium nitens TaxID=105231 RepID=A0A1Y1IJB0_KLENI|nr:hypothetical protein KFL_004550080 [Klebsormidium nitens]|eukprot:GAQ88737.1 hypothetical protein KFL_004550080 [Klebsormidium nitens]
MTRNAGSSRLSQRILSATLAAALILLPADGGNSTKAYASSPVTLPLAAAVTETVSADSAADLFAQLKGYDSAEHEAKASGKVAPPLKASGQDPITAAVESVKVAEELDVTKLPEVNGPAKVNTAKGTQNTETPASTSKPEVADGAQSSEGQTRVGGLLERLKKGADAGRSGIAGSLAESKQLLGAGRSKVGEIVGRVKEGVSDKIGGGKLAPESLPVESKAAPAEASGSPGGLKDWFGSWTGGKPSESNTESRGLFSGGSQTAQPPAKQARGFFQAKPPPKEEKTGLAGTWQSLTNLDFLPDNVKGGALTVKSAVSFVLTVLSLVLSVFAKALGVAADLIGIIARGL